MYVTQFRLVAAADVQTMSRVLNFFAQRNLTPVALSMTTSRDKLRMTVEVPDVPEHIAAIIAEKMRSSVLIHAVRVEMPA